MKHTPGPWTYLGGDLLADSPYWGQIRSENWYLIAQQPDGDDRHYDFVLMAAAPDLLEACKLALKALEQSGMITRQLLDADRELRAAIAKATGD